MISITGIETAAKNISGIVNSNNFMRSNALSDELGMEIFLKLENMQKTGSFKIRGAYNFITRHLDEAKKNGVITASAGNHALAVACASSHYKIDAELFMPKNAPLVKAESCKRLGAEVHLEGKNYNDALTLAKKQADETGKLFVNAFDDYDVIEGQGTIGLEIFENIRQPDYVIVPIGGGGLIAGIAYALKSRNPKIKIIGVQTREADSAYNSFHQGKIAETHAPKTIADGIAVKSVGEKTFPIIQYYVDDVVIVEEEEIARAVLMYMELAKIIVEGAGAVPLAALLSDKIKGIAGEVVLLVSGGNIDVNLIERIIETGLLRIGRIMKVVVDVDDVPGIMAIMAGSIADCGGNILQITHGRTEWGLPVGMTRIEFTVETRGYDHINQIVECIRSNGFKPLLRN
ncbi:MAG: threonine ammonia-lyase [Candidatus Schekmanbacteria bacterium]|nr:threonine ammonia-lyase [Candidatus Schekmanbacteria bacterium]